MRELVGSGVELGERAALCTSDHCQPIRYYVGYDFEEIGEVQRPIGHQRDRRIRIDSSASSSSPSVVTLPPAVELCRGMPTGRNVTA